MCVSLRIIVPIWGLHVQLQISSFQVHSITARLFNRIFNQIQIEFERTSQSFKFLSRSWSISFEIFLFDVYHRVPLVIFILLRSCRVPFEAFRDPTISFHVHFTLNSSQVQFKCDASSMHVQLTRIIHPFQVYFEIISRSYAIFIEFFSRSSSSSFEIFLLPVFILEFISWSSSSLFVITSSSFSSYFEF